VSPNDNFRRELNNVFDEVSGAPSPALKDRVRSAITEAPEARGPHLIAAVAAVVLTAVIVGVLYVANPLRQPSGLVGGNPTPTPSVATSPSHEPSPSPSAGLFLCSQQEFIPLETSPPTATPPVVFINAVRTGANGGYDRLVIDFANGMPSDVRVTGQNGTDFRLSPSDMAVKLKGQNGISVLIKGADLHTSYQGNRDLVTSYNGLAEVRVLEDFEGYVQLGLGVNGPACARVFLLTNPNRLVIDVQTS
jgi:hypothetical protein